MFRNFCHFFYIIPQFEAEGSNHTVQLEMQLHEDNLPRFHGIATFYAIKLGDKKLQFTFSFLEKLQKIIPQYLSRPASKLPELQRNT